MIVTIQHGDVRLALILRANYYAEGIQFFTPNDFSQQLGYMNRPQGYVIPLHVHNSVVRELHFIKEELFIKSGKVRVDFYDETRTTWKAVFCIRVTWCCWPMAATVLRCWKPVKFIEVKQGPYAGEQDKTRFKGVSSDKVKIKD